MIANYSYVQLLTDKYHAEGASTGDKGSVIEVYENGEYEVGFADENGIDFAQIVAREEELRVLTAEPHIDRPADNVDIVDTKDVTSKTGVSQRLRMPSLK